MSDLNIDELIEKFGKNYPDWLNRSLGIQISAMDKTLTKIFGKIDKVEDNVKTITKNSDKSLEEDKKLRQAIKKVSETLEKISKDTTNAGETKKVKTELTKLGKLLEKSNTQDKDIKDEIVKLTKTVETMSKGMNNSTMEKTFKTSIDKLHSTLEKIANDKTSSVDNDKLKTSLDKVNSTLEKIANDKTSSVDNDKLKTSLDKVNSTLEKIANDKTSSAENIALKNEIVNLNDTVKKLIDEVKDKKVEQSIVDAIDNLKNNLNVQNTTITDQEMQKSIDNLAKTIEELSKSQGIPRTGGNNSADQLNADMEDLSATVDELTKRNEHLVESLKKRNLLDREFERSYNRLTSELNSMGKNLSNNDLPGTIENFGSIVENLARSIPIIGNILGGAVAGISFGLTGLATEIVKTQSAYSQLSTTGIQVRDGFMGIRRAAHAGNMTLEELTGAMSQNVGAFVALGVDSGSIFANMAESARDTNSAFRRLGMTSEQINTFLSSNLEYQRLTGRLEGLTQDQRNRRANDEVRRFATLSSAFGVSMEALQLSAVQYATSDQFGIVAARLDDIDASGNARAEVTAARSAFEALRLEGQTLETFTQAIAQRAAMERGQIIESPEYMESYATVTQITSPEFLDRALQMQGMDPKSQEYADMLDELGQMMESSIDTTENIAALNDSSMFGQTVGGILGSEQRRRGMGETADERQAELEARLNGAIDPAVETITNFEETARTANVAFQKLATALLGTETIRNSLKTVSGVLEGFSSRIDGIDFDNMFSGFSGAVTEISQLFGIDPTTSATINSALTQFAGYLSDPSSLIMMIGGALVGKSILDALINRIVSSTVSGVINSSVIRGIASGIASLPVAIALIVAETIRSSGETLERAWSFLNGGKERIFESEQEFQQARSGQLQIIDPERYNEILGKIEIAATERIDIIDSKVGLTNGAYFGGDEYRNYIRELSEMSSITGVDYEYQRPKGDDLTNVQNELTDEVTNLATRIEELKIRMAEQQQLLENPTDYSMSQTNILLGMAEYQNELDSLYSQFEDLAPVLKEFDIDIPQTLQTTEYPASLSMPYPVPPSRPTDVVSPIIETPSIIESVIQSIMRPIIEGQAQRPVSEPMPYPVPPSRPVQEPLDNADFIKSISDLLVLPSMPYPVPPSRPIPEPLDNADFIKSISDLLVLPSMPYPVPPSRPVQEPLPSDPTAQITVSPLIDPETKQLITDLNEVLNNIVDNGLKLNEETQLMDAWQQYISTLPENAPEYPVPPSRPVQEPLDNADFIKSISDLLVLPSMPYPVPPSRPVQEPLPSDPTAQITVSPLIDPETKQLITDLNEVLNIIVDDGLKLNEETQLMDAWQQYISTLPENAPDKDRQYTDEELLQVLSKMSDIFKDTSTFMATIGVDTSSLTGVPLDIQIPDTPESLAEAQRLQNLVNIVSELTASGILAKTEPEFDPSTLSPESRAQLESVLERMNSLFGSSIPQLAFGGVAVGETLANIGEAGYPEMVMPLDPALHNLGKYIAEQHVSVVLPMNRQIQNELIYRLFRENEDPIDRIFTKSLNKFLFSKAEIESTMLAIQNFYSSDDYRAGMALPANLQNVLAVMGSMGVNPQGYYNRYSSPSAEPIGGNAGTTYAGMPASVAVPNIASEDVYRRFMNTIMNDPENQITNPYALAAIAATGSRESGFSTENAYRTWSDPSVSGQPGVAGGIMSWREDRYRNMLEFTGGDLSPEQQARFFLNENPQLIAQLENASSVEEAIEIMNNAWRFAGYQGGPEAIARQQVAQEYYSRGFDDITTQIPPSTSTGMPFAPLSSATTPVTPSGGGSGQFTIIGTSGTDANPRITIRDPSGKIHTITEDNFDEYFNSGTIQSTMSELTPMLSSLNNGDLITIPENILQPEFIQPFRPSTTTTPSPSFNPVEPATPSSFNGSFPQDYMPYGNTTPLTFGMDDTVTTTPVSAQQGALNKPNNDLLLVAMETNALLKKMINNQDAQTSAFRQGTGIIA